MPTKKHKKQRMVTDPMEKEEIIDWVLRAVEGAQCPATFHFDDISMAGYYKCDRKEWGVPIRFLKHIGKELKGCIQ